MESRGFDTAFSAIVKEECDRFIRKIKEKSNEQKQVGEIRNDLGLLMNASDTSAYLAYRRQVELMSFAETNVYSNLICNVLSRAAEDPSFLNKEIKIEWPYYSMGIPSTDDSRASFFESLGIKNTEGYMIPVEFVITRNRKRTGYCFLDSIISSDSYRHEIEDLKLDVYCRIDCSGKKDAEMEVFEDTADLNPIIKPEDFADLDIDASSAPFYYITNPPTIKTVSYKDFFKEVYLDISGDRFKRYNKKVRQTIKAAYQYIGFHTVNDLTPHYNKLFIEKVLLNLRDSVSAKTEYKFISESTKEDPAVRNRICNTPLCSEIEQMKALFFTGHRCRAFGNSRDFARSYITAEYLYSEMKDKSKFDYTAIVCGYSKSIEQLLYEIVMYILKVEKPNDSQICSTKIFQSFDINNESSNRNICLFKPMIDLLYSYDGWLVSNATKNLIIGYLHAFRIECRNDHFHKDNIYDYEEVDKIRNNTQLLYMYLLGSLPLTHAAEKAEIAMETGIGFLNYEHDPFLSIYAAIMQYADVGDYVILTQADGTVINTVLAAQRDVPSFDDYGALQDGKIELIKVDEVDTASDWNGVDFISFTYESRDGKAVYISKNNIPKGVHIIEKSTGEDHEIVY